MNVIVCDFRINLQVWEDGFMGTSRRFSTVHDERYRRIVEVLVERRLSAGVSQASLSVALKLCQPDVSKVEKFVRRLDALELFDWVTALAELTNSDPKEMFDVIYTSAYRPRASSQET